MDSLARSSIKTINKISLCFSVVLIYTYLYDTLSVVLSIFLICMCIYHNKYPMTSVSNGKKSDTESHPNTYLSRFFCHHITLLFFFTYGENRL